MIRRPVGLADARVEAEDTGRCGRRGRAPAEIGEAGGKSDHQPYLFSIADDIQEKCQHQQRRKARLDHRGIRPPPTSQHEGQEEKREQEQSDRPEFGHRPDHQIVRTSVDAVARADARSKHGLAGIGDGKVCISDSSERRGLVDRTPTVQMSVRPAPPLTTAVAARSEIRLATPGTCSATMPINAIMATAASWRRKERRGRMKIATTTAMLTQAPRVPETITATDVTRAMPAPASRR